MQYNLILFANLSYLFEFNKVIKKSLSVSFANVVYRANTQLLQYQFSGSL